VVVIATFVAKAKINTGLKMQYNRVEEHFSQVSTQQKLSAVFFETKMWVGFQHLWAFPGGF